MLHAQITSSFECSDGIKPPQQFRVLMLEVLMKPQCGHVACVPVEFPAHEGLSAYPSTNRGLFPASLGILRTQLPGS
jgi:hypothetical protein